LCVRREVGGSSWCDHETSCSTQYATFLSTVKAGLRKAAPLHSYRVTVDAQCSASAGGGVTTNCAELAQGADVFMNMDTYNSASYEDWMRALAPAIAPEVPRSQLGAGLGCWIEHLAEDEDENRGRRLQPVPAWSLSAESAEQRVCVLMNHSVVEIDMFRINPGSPSAGPWLGQLEFWVPQLRKFMSGGGCVIPAAPPPPPSGPAVGCPASGWVRAETAGDAGCCTLLSANINTTGCGASTQNTCAAFWHENVLPVDFQQDKPAISTSRTKRAGTTSIANRQALNGGTYTVS
jgi:hypothetical protein